VTDVEQANALLLGEVRGKVDLILLAITNRNLLEDDRHHDHDKRITALERVRWYVGGAVALVMAAAAKLSFFPH
jgi:hypothetical protein